MNKQLDHRTGSGREGFALPAAIFALLVVALLVTSGFFLANQETRIGQSSERAGEAFRLAETGMNEVLALWRPAQANLPLWEPNTGCAQCQGSQGDGEWLVSVTRVDDQLYLVESTGTVTQGGFLAGASRTVSRMARGGVIDVVPPNAAVTTQTQLRVSGSATLDGNDTNGGGSGWFMSAGAACPPASGGRPAVLMNEGADFHQQGGGSDILAPPGVDPVTYDDQTTQESMSVFDADRWNALTSMATISLNASGPHSIQPAIDGDGACDLTQSLNWGSPKELSGGRRDASIACQNYFPIIHITVPGSGDRFQINANSAGQGILLVDGNLHLNGNFDWGGPIYVRGEFSNNGGTGVYGGVISMGAEISSDTDQVVSGNAEVTYSSCAVSRAVAGASGNIPLRPLANRGWADVSASAF